LVEPGNLPSANSKKLSKQIQKLRLIARFWSVCEQRHMATTTIPISELLDEQYNNVEDYANSQSRLVNAFLKRNTMETEEGIDVAMAMEQQDTSRQRIQGNFRRLFEIPEFHTKYKPHMDLSYRVVQTISNNPTWHPMGIPSHVDGILQSNTVALACLRASITKIKEIESST